MSNNKKLTQRLNETGFPFQEWCFSILKKINKNELITKEYSFTLTFPNLGIAERGQIDVLTILLPGNRISPGTLPISVCVIECKRSDQTIKNWCFIRTNRQGVDPKTFFLKTHYGDNGRKTDTLPLENSKIGFGINDGKSIDIKDIVIFGYETNDLLENVNRNQEQKIYKPLTQVIMGSYFIESKEYLRIRELNITKESIENYIRSKPLLHVPILITTADLWVAEFDAVNVSNGELESANVNWQKEDWVLYDFGLPEYLQHGINDMNSRAIFIVNYKTLESFFENLKPTIW